MLRRPARSRGRVVVGALITLMVTGCASLIRNGKLATSDQSWQGRISPLDD